MKFLYFIMLTFMEKNCPICGGEMKKVGSGKDLPSVPFIKIPEWIKETVVYECEKCGFIGLWHE